MKQFACGDVVPGCTRTFLGTDDEILSAVAHHARHDHGLSSVSDELAAAVRGAVRPVGV